MKQYTSMWTLGIFLMTAPAAVAADAGGFRQQGGFTGPAVGSATVEQARAMRDDRHVILRGHIVRHLGGDRYEFRDDTGSITVEIDEDDWHGVSVSPADLVEIYGEVDKGFRSVEIDVHKVAKVAP